MKYYFLSHQNLKEGSVIHPGAWGYAVINTPGHRYLKMERQFEAVRLSIDQNLPSRLTSVFLFDNYTMATKFQVLQRPKDSLYEVSIRDGSTPTHVADMMLVHPELEQWNAEWGNPRLYWESANIEETAFREVLTTSPAEVIRKINDGLTVAS